MKGQNAPLKCFIVECLVLIKGSHRAGLCHSSMPLQINHFRAFPLSLLCSSQLPRAWSRAADGGIPLAVCGSAPPKAPLFWKVLSSLTFLSLGGPTRSHFQPFFKKISPRCPWKGSLEFLHSCLNETPPWTVKSMPLVSPLQLLCDLYVMVRRSDTLHQIPCVEVQQILDPFNSFTRCSNAAASTLWKICIVGSQVFRSFLADTLNIACLDRVGLEWLLSG